MSDPIDRPIADSAFLAARIKLKRAAMLIAQLKQELEAFAQGYARQARSRFPGGKVLTEVTFMANPGPVMAGAIAADAVHNLRCALDLMASELVRRSGHPDAQALFPFARSAQELEDEIKNKKFRVAGDDAIAVLRDLKPYTGGNADLRGLHELDVEDKHFARVPTSVVFTSSIVDHETENSLADEPQITGLTFTYPDGTPFEGQEILRILPRLRDLVDAVVDEFDELLVRRTAVPR